MGTGRRLATLAAAFVLAMGVALLPRPAAAHKRAAAGAQSGLAIPGLTHGEMAVVEDYASAIRDLARRQTRTNPTFRRLVNFAALQRTYCLWGLMPGSVSDEDSPFNACMHAYLSALRAVLVQMEDMPERQDAARTLGEEIATQMRRRDAMDAICRSSGESFNTADVIIPEWSEIADHPPSLLSAGTVALSVAGAGMLLLVRRRPR